MATASTAATPTSSGVWQPRYIREKGTSTSSSAAAMRTQVLFVQSSRHVMVPTMFWVWPEGKE